MKKILVALILLVSLSSCQKEYSEQFVAYSSNPLNTDTTWRVSNSTNDAVNLIIPALFNAPMLDSFDVVTGGELHFPDNLLVTFPPHSCTGPSGAAINGKIRVEFTYLRKKGDFIRYAKPTTSYNYLLQTGGSFNVVLTQNGYPVFLAPNISYKIKYRNPAPSTDMKFFYEDLWVVNNDTTATWVSAINTQMPYGTVSIWQQYDTLTQSIIKGYEITSTRLHWINCDFFNDTTQPYTRMNVSLPLNFTNVNTNVYVVFKNKNIVGGLNSDFASKTFFYSRIPIGSDVTLVSVSKIGNDYYLGKKEATVNNANLISVNPEPKSLADISNYLNSL